MDGQKFDQGKPDWSLLSLDLLEPVVRVLTEGAAEYGRENWKKVPNRRNRYYAATMRHLKAWQKGDIIDSQFGLPHLAHAICDLLFLMWIDEDSKTTKNEDLEKGHWAHPIQPHKPPVSHQL